jgi:hypothetical protein
MRLAKTIGLAAVAALAVMAYVGASTASADWLCEENLAHTATCPAGKQVALNSLIVGLAINKSAKLLNENSEVEMECNSIALGKFLGQEGTSTHKPVLGLMTKFEFSSCSGLCTTAKGINLNYLLLAVAATLLAHVSEDGAGKPGAILKGCPFGAECKFLVEGTSALLSVTGDTMVAAKIPLEKVSTSFLCEFFPDLAYWDASYLLTLDTNNEHKTPIYLTLLP